MTEELQKINEEASKFYNYEQAVKLMLNSIYGAFGNPYFYFFNVDIAETITLQGKDAILYTENLVNKYFKEYWHKDTAAHQAMGITGFTLSTLYRWVTSEAGRRASLHSFINGHYLGSGQAHRVMEEAHLHGQGQFTAISNYAKRIAG